MRPYSSSGLLIALCALSPAPAGAGPGEPPPPPAAGEPSAIQGESASSQDAALAAILEAVAAMREASSKSAAEPPLDDALAKLRADFGRFRTQADGAARNLKTSATESDAHRKLASEHAELSRSAQDARLLLDIIESLGASPEEDVLGISSGHDIPHGDLDALAAWVDGVFEGVWKRRGIRPAPEAPRTTLLRRAFLDIHGVIPSRDVVERFASDGGNLGQGEVIDKVLDYTNVARGGYARNFASITGVELIGRGYLPDDKHRAPFIEWLETVYSKNVRYDRWVTELITETKRNTREPSPTVFLAARQSSAVANTTKISSQFLGINLQCAECHDHPYERWTQDDFHGMAAFLARQKEKDIGGNVYVLEDTDKGEAEYQTPAGEKHTASMRYLDGTGADDGPGPSGEQISRRERFAAMLSGDFQFALARVNRMWAHFLGRGLVEPLDGFSSDNPPSVPFVLDVLAAKYRESGFDDRWLIRVLGRLKPYRLETGPPPPDGWRSFSAFPMKALTAEQVFESIVTAGRLDEALGREMGESSRKLLGRYRDEFIGVYAWDPEQVSDPNEGTLPQALALLNNRLVIEACSPRPGSTVDLSLGVERDERIQFVYSAALGREPSAEERERAEAFLASVEDPRAGAGDLLWSLINSAEFRFNH